MNNTKRMKTFYLEADIVAVIEAMAVRHQKSQSWVIDTAILALKEEDLKKRSSK